MGRAFKGVVKRGVCGPFLVVTRLMSIWFIRWGSGMLSILRSTGWSFPRRTVLSQCLQFLWRNTRGLGAWLSSSHSWLLFHLPAWACTLPLTHFPLLKNVSVTGLERERQGLNPKSRGAQQRGHQPGRARVGNQVSLRLLLLLCKVG